MSTNNQVNKKDPSEKTKKIENSDMQKETQQTKRSGNVLSQVFAILFILFGLMISLGAFFSGLLLIIAGLLCLPRIQAILEKKTKKTLPKGVIVGAVVVLVVISLVALPKTEEVNEISTDSTSESESQKTITIPSLVEYDDDMDDSDENKEVEQEDVVVPSDHTVVSPDNLDINDPVGAEALVSEVVDGDTVKLSDGNKVRILGIDTPETKDPRKPVQCFGEEASLKMTELVDDKKVTLLVDEGQGDKDKYGRLLRYIYIGNTDIGAEMVRQGYAFAYTKYPVSKMDGYVALEQEARENKAGLWAEDTCNGSTELVQDETTVPESEQETESNPQPVLLPTSDYSCNCSKTCDSMSCDEAYYQLNTCGCSRRDGDKDGVPCESICPGG